MPDDTRSPNRRTASAAGVLIALALLTAGLALLGTAQAETTDWLREAVADGSDGEYISLALDEQDAPHVVYYDEDNQFTYATRTDGSWSSEQIPLRDMAAYTSIALDDEGDPHVAYKDGLDLMYAVRDGDGWSTEIVDLHSMGHEEGHRTSIAIDSDGDPHIAYYSFDHGAVLRYAVKDGGSWEAETVFDGGRFPSLALDAQDRPHVSYATYGDGGLTYATKRQGSWENTTVHEDRVDDGSSAAGHTSIALDSQGNPHISYHDAEEDGLRHAARQGGTWSHGGVQPEGGQYSSMVVAQTPDGEDVPVIAYQDAGRGELGYTFPVDMASGASWIVETVDDGDAGGYASLALDSQGNPHIVYRDAGEVELAEKTSLPSASFSASPSSPSPGETVQFTDESEDPDGTIQAWTWNFGDGTTSSDRSPSHAFARGTHTVNLTVTDDNGVTNSAQRTIDVEEANSAPDASFRVSSLSPRVQESVQFVDESQDPDGAIQTWQWDLGDGNTSTERSPTHTYTEAGEKDVCLEVEDDGGLSDRSCRTLTVQPASQEDEPSSSSSDDEQASPDSDEELQQSSTQDDESSGSEEGSAKAAPQRLIAREENGNVVLSWQAPEGVTPSGWTIYRSTNASDWIEKATVPETQWIDATAQPGESYHYRVVTQTAEGPAGEATTSITRTAADGGGTANDAPGLPASVAAVLLAGCAVVARRRGGR